MTNNYQLAGRLQTTGWNPSFDVNAKNSFNMTPAEVAIQAGDVSEFAAITSHPSFDAKNMGRVHLFMDICRRDSDRHYEEIKQYFEANFKLDPDRLDPTRRGYVKLS